MQGVKLFSKNLLLEQAISDKCLVLADGFYEWHTEKNSKQPNFIYFDDRRLFAFAALYNHWENHETGERNGTFTILTTKANSIMVKIHNKPKYAQDHRMPVIIQENEFDEWLKSDEDSMKEYFITKDLALTYYPVNKGLHKNAEMNNS